MVNALEFGFVDPLWPDALISCTVRACPSSLSLSFGGPLIISYSTARAGGLATRAKLFFLTSPGSVLLHWLTVLVLAPLGRYYPMFGVVALPAYLALRGQVLLSRGKRR